MAKSFVKIFSCSKCGAQTPKWAGRCLECGAWGTLIEDIANNDSSQNNIAKTNYKPAQIIDLTQLEQKNLKRLTTNINEVDRVLGGGFAPGSIVLLSGEPGIGKSTILAQIAHGVTKTDANAKIIYASGEESAPQVKERLERLNCNLNAFQFVGETQVEKIIALAKNSKPLLLIVDSIQTMRVDQIDNEIGSPNQLKASGALFLEFSKKENIPTIIVGHITKDGAIAGPKNLEHMVDVVLYFETDTTHHYRLLRATKNRFGSTNELGLLEMTSSGFQEVKNPSALFWENTGEAAPGSITSCFIDGARPFLTEVQALANKTFFGYPQRKTSGFDLNRLQILSAVLSKRTPLNVNTHDIFLNIAGGFKVQDPALDLAVAAAITSAFLNTPITKTLILGEIGLSGEIRPVSRLNERYQEAKKLGIKNAIVPASGIIKDAGTKGIENIRELIEIIKT